MSTKMIEAELAAVKKRLERLEAMAGPERPADWRAGFGALKGAVFLRDAARLGAAYRARENKRK